MNVDLRSTYQVFKYGEIIVRTHVHACLIVGVLASNPGSLSWGKESQGSRKLASSPAPLFGIEKLGVGPRDEATRKRHACHVCGAGGLFKQLA